MKDKIFTKRPISDILQFVSGVAGGVLLTIIFSWFYQIAGWTFAGTYDKQVTFLFFSLVFYPIGVWLGIYLTGKCNKAKHYFWLSLSGLFLAVSLFLIYATLSSGSERSFYFYWGLHYTIYPVLVFLGAHRLFLKKA